MNNQRCSNENACNNTKCYGSNPRLNDTYKNNTRQPCKHGMRCNSHNCTYLHACPVAIPGTHSLCCFKCFTNNARVCNHISM